MPDVLVRDLRPEVIAAAKQAASERGISLGRLLAEAISERFSGQEPRVYDDLDALAGTWTQADLSRFEEAVAPLGQIEPALWRKPKKRARG